jgi:hypothetical protein
MDCRVKNWDLFKLIFDKKSLRKEQTQKFLNATKFWEKLFKDILNNLNN